MKLEDKIREMVITIKNLSANPPSGLVDLCTERIMEVIEKEQAAQDMEKDILVLVLRLVGEDPSTFSPEVAEVMEKWGQKARDVLTGNHSYEL